MKKILIPLLAVVIFLGCASLKPMKSLKDSDLFWEERIINVNFQEVHRRILKGFRDCDWQGIYFVENNLYTDIAEGHFFVYSNGGLPGVKVRGPYVIGKIITRAAGEQGTKITAGVTLFWKDNKASNTFRTTDWLRMADGDYSWCEE